MQNFSADSFISLFEMIKSARNSEYTYQEKMGGSAANPDDEAMVPIDLLTFNAKMCPKFNEAIDFENKSKSNFADLLFQQKVTRPKTKLWRKADMSFENSFLEKGIGRRTV